MESSLAPQHTMFELAHLVMVILKALDCSRMCR